MSKILIADDEEKLRTLLTRIIRLEGFDVMTSGDCQTALKKLEESETDVVVCDVKLPDGNGVDFVKKIKEKFPYTEVILLTAYGNISDGVQAIKNGAYDYIIKGDDNNRIIPLLHRAYDKVQLAKRIHQLEQQVGKKYSFKDIIGTSEPILAAIEQAKKAAPSDAAVLLLGETGTGKEVFAQAIHQASKRKNKSFVALNCAAFNKELLESELFGHKAGAFTGAMKDKKGLFEEAHNGTIFLDEIGEMSGELQAKLLRVLETGEFIKIGEIHPTKVNVRFIAATNRTLQEEMEAGRFRNDLFYRLSVFQIMLPPLRERVEDIGPLAKFFAEQFAVKNGKKHKRFSSDFVKLLKYYPWKGNIRELKNAIERSVILSENEMLQSEDLPYEVQQTSDDKDKQFSAFSLASVEKLHIQKVLNYTHGNKSETARLLNIGLTTLYRKIEEYQLT